MPARSANAAQERDYDYTNVGKVGRRTGLTLDARPKDQYGMEEMTGLFSSPKKPSPIRSKAVLESIEVSERTPRASNLRSAPETPATIGSARRSTRGSSHVIPRSASPRKSGITGSARRSGPVQIVPEQLAPQEAEAAPEPEPELAQEDEQAQEQPQQPQLSSREAEAENVPTPRFVPKVTRTPVAATRLPPAKSARPATVRRFSPSRTPLRDHILGRKAKSAFVPRVSDVQPLAPEDEPEDATIDTPSHIQTKPTEPEITIQDNADLLGVPEEEETATEMTAPGTTRDEVEPTLEEPEVEPTIEPTIDESVGPPIEEPTVVTTVELTIEPTLEETVEEDQEDSEPELPPLAPPVDDEDEDTTYELPKPQRTQNKANSRRKRKSDAILEAVEAAAATSSPAAKRAKRRSDEGVAKKRRRLDVVEEDEQVQEEEQEQEQERPPARQRAEPGRKALSKKDSNLKLSKSQQKEVDGVVERMRQRPGGARSLAILRRETPLDDNVTRTRSGRVSFKPVAYWRNEGVVYDAGDGSGQGIEDGERFPHTSIKEIVRIEDRTTPLRPRKGGRQKGKQKAQLDDESDRDLEDEDNNADDPDADDWEVNQGTLNGPVSVWDANAQGPSDDTEEVELAHAVGAVETQPVKGQMFKYAKLMSTAYSGTGLVDLPPGGGKGVKNSRKMHMNFYVVQGRCSVVISPVSGKGTRFSIGKGGFFQVPRGTNYSLENEHGRTARLIFFQACESVRHVYADEE